jgi:hypothetical protein
MDGPEEMASVLGDATEDQTAIGFDQSPFERLRRKRRQIAEVKDLDMDIPGYGGELVCKYKLLNWDHIRRIGSKHQNSRDPQRLLLAQMDLLIEACVGFYYRKGDELKPLHPDKPVRYDLSLAEILDIELDEQPSARKVCLGVFVNDLALVDHHQDLLTWMRGAQEEVDEDIAGESLGPRR